MHSDGLIVIFKFVFFGDKIVTCIENVKKKKKEDIRTTPL